MTSSLSNAGPSPSGTVPPAGSDQAQRRAGVRLKLFVGQATIGIGQIDLLQRIGQTGSLGLAATQMNMDEARAESLLDLTSAGFCAPLVTTAATDSKALELTELGTALIQHYRDHDSRIQDLSADLKDWLTEQQVKM